MSFEARKPCVFPREVGHFPKALGPTLGSTSTGTMIICHFGDGKHMGKSQSPSLGHIPFRVSMSFTKDAASMHCSTVRPRPSQMSRYSCEELPPAPQRSAQLVPQITQSTVNCPSVPSALTVERPWHLF